MKVFIKFNKNNNKKLRNPLDPFSAFLAFKFIIK